MKKDKKGKNEPKTKATQDNLLSMPNCEFTDGKKLTVNVSTGECSYSIMVIRIDRSGSEPSEDMVGTAEPIPAIPPKIKIDNVFDKITWSGSHPTAGQEYLLYVFALDSKSRQSKDFWSSAIKCVALPSEGKPKDTATAPATKPPVTAPAETPAVTALVPPPVKPVPSVPVATVAPAKAKPAPVSKEVARLIGAIKVRLKLTKFILEGNPEIMNMGMGRGLKHQHAETCGNEFNRITEWVGLTDQNNKLVLQDILDQAGCLKAAVWSLKCQIEEQNERKNERHAARSATSPIAPAAPQPEVQQETVVREPAKPAQAPQVPAPVIPPVLRPAAAAIQTPPPVIQERPAVAQENVPPPAIPQIPAGTPVPTRVPKRFGGHKVVAMLLALIAFLAFLFAFGVVVYAMYRSSPGIGPGASQSHSLDAERMALAEATMARDNEHQALEAAKERVGLVAALASMPKPEVNVSVIVNNIAPAPIMVQPQANNEPAPSCIQQVEQQAPTPVEVCQQPEVVQQQAEPCYYPSYAYCVYWPSISLNFGGRYRNYCGPSVRPAFGGRNWNGHQGHSSGHGKR